MKLAETPGRPAKTSPADAGERWEVACRLTGGLKTQFAQRHWQNKVKYSAGKGRDLYALSWMPKKGERKYVFHVCVPSNTEPTLDELVSLCKERYQPWVGQKQRRTQSLPAPASLHHSQSTSNLSSAFTVHENPTWTQGHGPLQLHAKCMGAKAFDPRTPTGPPTCGTGVGNSTFLTSPRLRMAHSSPYPGYPKPTDELATDTGAAAEASEVRKRDPIVSPIATPTPTFGRSSRRSLIGRDTSSSRHSSNGGASDLPSAAQTPGRASPSGIGSKTLVTITKLAPLSPPGPMSQVGEDTQSCWGSLTRSGTQIETGDRTAGVLGQAAGDERVSVQGTAVPLGQRIKAALKKLTVGCFRGTAA